jgi:simple sugar transport system permease protein
MKGLTKTLISRPEFAALAVLIVLGAVFYANAPVFLSAGNWRVLLGIIPELGFLALGVTVLMIAGEFDLSVGSMFAVGGMLPPLLSGLGVDPWLSLAITTAAGLAVGYTNAFITLTFGIPSFITTLGMLFAARSVALILSGGHMPVWTPDLPDALFTGNIVQGGLIRASFVWYAGVAIILGWVLHRSNFGNWIFATGAHRQSAQDMGINTRRVKTVCFMICSVLATWGGIFAVMRAHMGMPNQGETFELQAIAASVIGGVALFGGFGSIIGPVVGVFVIRMLDNGLIMFNVGSGWFKLAIGALLIAAVVFNVFLLRHGQRMRLVAEAARDDDANSKSNAGSETRA